MIQNTLLEYFEIERKVKELNELKKALKEEVESFFYESGEDKLFFEVSDTEMVVVERAFSVKEKLDKDGLSLEVGIAKDEMKTPFDWSMLTKQEKISPKQISMHTHNETDEKIKIKKKRKPKGSKAFKAPEGQTSIFDEDVTGIQLEGGEKLVLNFGGGEATLTKHNSDGTTEDIPSETKFFN
jgi:hypothetical protein